VSSDAQLLAVVDVAFVDHARGLAPWPDPHEGRSPADDEYSRVTNAARYRLIGARADAWITVLTGRGLASLHDDVTWSEQPHSSVIGAERLEPTAPSALNLVVARSRIADVADAGVTLGVDHPTVLIAAFPSCGCDACDSGSQDELDDLDRHILAVVTGRYRRLTQGDRGVTVLGESGWSAWNLRRDQALAVLDDPTGWDEVSGAPWDPPTHRSSR